VVSKKKKKGFVRFYNKVNRETQGFLPLHDPSTCFEANSINDDKEKSHFGLEENDEI